MANRLSEDASATVLLLEAGPLDRHPFQYMPLGFRKVAMGRLGTWQYLGEPEPQLDNRRLVMPRGRTLGGSSSINAMIAIRGNRRDYDRLAEQGLEGWGYADVLPHFKRLENSWHGDGPFHATGGPIGISPVEGRDMLFEPLCEAAVAAGIAHCPDPNGASQDGISRMEATIWNGERSGTGRGYLHPVMSRSNLTVRTRTLVERIQISGGRAKGVTFRVGNSSQTARALGEIIVCGGAYNSPQLMLLSGIGPTNELSAMGIEPLHDLPGVGRNLSDHPNFIFEASLKEKLGLTRHLRFDRAVAGAIRWWLTREGPFASSGATANIFLRTEPGLDRPDAQIIAMPVSNSAEMWLPGVTPPPQHASCARIGPLHPKSRGQVRLRSADPRDPPRILTNMFAEPDDMATMIRAIKIVRDIFAHDPLRSMIASETSPGRDASTDAELERIVRQTGSHRAQPVGTCRVGLDDDAVVDAKLKVRGIAGLRIADASVLPELPSGNTNLPSIMIGEKAADMVRHDR